MIVFKIGFGQVAVHVSFRDVVELAIDRTLQEREETLGRVGRVEAADARVFVSAVVHGAMASELRADRRIDHAFVGSVSV